MARRRPYRQGSLDGLCGLYAVVNAIDLLHPMDADEAWDLFHRLVRELERRDALAVAITGGVGKSRAWKLLKLAARHVQREQDVRIEVRRPFRRRSLISVEAFYAALEQELGRGAVAIIGLLDGSGHWTVLNRIGTTMLLLHDSNGYRAIRRSSCQLQGADAETRYEIEQSATMILHRRQDRVGASAARITRRTDRRASLHRVRQQTKAASGDHRGPYRQGHLDSLCGLYAVLNAVDLLHPLDAAASSGLTSRLVDELEKRGILADAIAGGITGLMVWRLVNIAAEFLREEVSLRIAVERSFRKRRFTSAEDFFDALELEMADGCAAIVCITGRFELPHWSVVRRVTPQTIQLQDSAGMRYLRRSGCRLNGRAEGKQAEMLPAKTIIFRADFEA